MSTRGEFQRLRDLAPHLAMSGPGLPVGVGDDAAVVEVGATAVVACVDVIAEGVHFTTELSSPADIGWKAVAVNISDLAAMGAEPLAVLVGLQRRPDLDEAVIDGLFAGMAEACREYGAALVGGDTVTAPTWSVAVTALGRPAVRSITRDGARPGDDVVLVGPLGMAAAALELHTAGEEVPEPLLAAHRRPQAHPRAGMALAAVGASAMIDLSDGLGQDAAHIARASGVALQLDRQAVLGAAPQEVVEAVAPDRLDRLVIGGGEDFALLATVPPSRRTDVEARLAEAEPVGWRWIGTVTAGEGEVWLSSAGLDGVGAPERIDGWGYDHG